MSLNKKSPGRRRKARSPHVKNSTQFPIVGIGASAGGLEAFMELFRNLPPSTGMAFVLVQHLSPQHLSLLTTLVQKGTQMHVQEAKDGMRIAQNCVYIIPPNSMIEIFHGVLHLSPLLISHGSSLPINVFMNSLARDQGNCAIGVVLSGTGSDGANGLRDIKAEGGITLVQEPSTAKFDGMPRAAISVSAPDHVVPVDGIARELARIARDPIVKMATPIDDSVPTDEMIQHLQKIYILLRTATKVDFSFYKYPTVLRRIRRRMVLHRIDTIKQYLDYLHVTPLEVRSLFDDLLINVTDFFRDADAFESLKTEAFPEILKDRRRGVPIRVWVPGCSTGEEAYSIAITLLEYLGDDAAQYPVQIYGTDICESAIKIARGGFYPESSSKNVSAARLKRFFVKDAGGYRVSKVVRDCCIFSIQDVISQPPINRLDLLSCRNLMIYLGPLIQKKLMETFFYSLNQRGFLMLGSSETIGTASSLFAIVDKKYKIYIKKSTLLQPRLDFQMATLPVPSSAADASVRPLRAIDPVTEAERRVLDQYAPAWVLVNSAMEIVQFRGPTRNFIEPASGQPSWNLMKMLRAGLSPDVRVLIHAAMKGRKSAKKEGIEVASEGKLRTIDVEALPLAPTGADPHCLVLFIERAVKSLENLRPSPADRKKAQGTLIEGLKSELIAMQKSFQSIIDEQNLTKDEMQSANEEVLSANEELQSTNEELETAKEELQSTNEELTTLNDELSEKNNELAHISNDLENVLNNVNISIVIVDLDLKIRRFTPMAEKLLKLIPSDVGRNLLDINLGFQLENLPEKISEVLRTMSTLEIESHDRQGVFYSVRIRPYKTSENKIDGAVLVFININEAKNREKAVQTALQYSDGIIQTVRDPLLVLDEKMHVERANQAFYDTFHALPETTIGRSLFEQGDGQWDIPQLRLLVGEVLPRKEEVRDYEIVHEFEKIGKKTMVLNARTLEWEGQKKLLMLITLHDVSEREKRIS